MLLECTGGEGRNEGSDEGEGGEFKWVEDVVGGGVSVE